MKRFEHMMLFELRRIGWLLALNAATKRIPAEMNIDTLADEYYEMAEGTASAEADDDHVAKAP